MPVEFGHVMKIRKWRRSLRSLARQWEWPFGRETVEGHLVERKDLMECHKITNHGFTDPGPSPVWLFQRLFPFLRDYRWWHEPRKITDNACTSLRVVLTARGWSQILFHWGRIQHSGSLQYLSWPVRFTNTVLSFAQRIPPTFGKLTPSPAFNVSIETPYSQGQIKS
jgi:hypothetical protein